MRSLPAVLAILFLGLAQSARSEEPAFGYYGYRHQELHQKGVIDKLIKRFKSNCCDGGNGGECRVTAIRIGAAGAREALLDGAWCPLNIAGEIPYDIELPEGAFAVVCASKLKWAGVCPVAYCAAASSGN